MSRSKSVIQKPRSSYPNLLNGKSFVSKPLSDDFEKDKVLFVGTRNKYIKSFEDNDKSPYDFVKRKTLETKLTKIKELSDELLATLVNKKESIMESVPLYKMIEKTEPLIKDIEHFSQRMGKYFAKSRYSFSKDLLDRIDILQNELGNLKINIDGEGDSIQAIKSFYSNITSNKELMHEIECVDKRSITLDTYKIGNVKFSEDAKTYEDEYQYKDSKASKVKHFGINHNRADLSEEIESHNTNQTNKIVNNSIFSKFSRETKNVKEFSKYIDLIQVENLVIDEAIEYLNQDKSTNNTVLVDIMARSRNGDNKGMIVDHQNKADNVHTVLLYKSNEKIFVVDPNNPQYSAFLKNYSDAFEVDYSTKNNVYTSKTKETGFGNKEGRDCVDIAVKIAFILNIIEQPYSKIKDIYKFTEILSNNEKLDMDIFYSQESAVRLKQSSDPSTRKDFNTKKIAFKDEYNEAVMLIISQCSTDIYKNLDKKMKYGFSEVLLEGKSHSGQNLVKYITECQLGTINTIETDLSGAIDQYFANGGVYE